MEPVMGLLSSFWASMVSFPGCGAQPGEDPQVLGPQGDRKVGPWGAHVAAALGVLHPRGGRSSRAHAQSAKARPAPATKGEARGTKGGSMARSGEATASAK